MYKRVYLVCHFLNTDFICRKFIQKSCKLFLKKCSVFDVFDRILNTLQIFPSYVWSMYCTLRKRCPNTEFRICPYFPLFSPNTGKYGPEISPYLDTFHAVLDDSEAATRGVL